MRELVKAGFNVTAFTRTDSTATFPENVTVKKVDYRSVESLIPLLEGQDAVVSTIATVAIGSQKALVDAAIAAKVKRFISSEFGINTRTVGDAAIGKILGGKVKVLDYIIEKSEENPWFTWNGVSSGLFFDWVRALLITWYNRDIMTLLTGMSYAGAPSRIGRI